MLEVTNLTRGGAFRDVSFDVRAGEIVGMAGLVGAGRSEVARVIFGADKRGRGHVLVDGVPSARRVRARGDGPRRRHGAGRPPAPRPGAATAGRRSNLTLPMLAFADDDGSHLVAQASASSSRRS